MRRLGAIAVALLAMAQLAACAVPPLAPAPASPDVPADSGSGRRIVYRKSTQEAWLVEADESVVDAFRVSGRLNIPNPGVYQVFHKVNPGSSGSLRLPYFVGFAQGRTTDIGFHGIPLQPNGQPIESDAQLGTPLSHGCVRVSQATAREIWDWAGYGTFVVVLA